jgi:hypothetical protein
MLAIDTNLATERPGAALKMWHRDALSMPEIVETGSAATL